MPFDITQSYNIVEDACGNKYYQQGGSLYSTSYPYASTTQIACNPPSTQPFQVMEGTQFATGSLIDGNAVIVNMQGVPLKCTVWTVPVAGDTVTVSYSVDGGITYTTWPNGAVTSASNDGPITPITHVKFQRTAGSGTTSRYGVTQ